MGRKKIKKKAAGDEQICRKRIGKWKCKNASSDNKLRFCEKHYKQFEDFCRNKIKPPTKKKTSGDGEGCSTATGMETDRSLDETGGIRPTTTDIDGGSANVGTKKLPPDEQYCCQTADDDAGVPKTKYCEKHYNCHARYSKKFLQKRSGDGGGAGAGCSNATGPVGIRRSQRLKTEKEEDETGEIQPATRDNTSNTIVEDGGSPKFGMKRKTVEKAQRSGDLKSLTKFGEPVVELENLEQYKSKCFELTAELQKQKMELEKKNVEYTTLQRKYAELETKKTAAEDKDAVKYWRNKCSDLESLILMMEIENPRMQCGVSRVSNFESLVTRNGKETSISRCEELRSSAEIESEVQGLQHEITETGENQRYKDNMSTVNAEANSGGRKDSRVYGLKTDVNKLHIPKSEYPKYSALNISSGSPHLASGGENIEVAKGWGCSEWRPFEHGSSSQANLEMSKENFVNLVSDSDDESVDSLGDPMDMLATENSNRNKHEMKWKSEIDMLSSFEEDPDLCMRAVCALYRQEISEDEISPKGLVIDSDTLRCTTLAKFLTDNDCKGDLKKSVEELEKFDSKAVGDCKKLVRRYSIYLFDIYKNRKDPFFLTATTASNGDQTAK